jgi:hypothetical protein
VIGVPVEFDGQPLALAFDHQVDAEPADAVLDLDPVSVCDEVTVDVTLEVGIETVFHVAGRVVDPRGILAVADEPAASIIGMELIGGDLADAPHLVLGSAGRDVDPLPVGFLGHRPDTAALAGGYDQ